jgi:hypothetical protein
MDDSELEDATWELDPKILARALSAKTRTAKAPLLTVDADFQDQLTHYNIEIDDLDQVLRLNSASRAFQPPERFPRNSEWDSHDPLCEFLNACLDACRQALGEEKIYYGDLKFFVYDKPMKDKVTGANGLKPDITGTTNPTAKDIELWWKPPLGEQSLPDNGTPSRSTG